MTQKYAKNRHEFWNKRCKEIPGEDSAIVEKMLSSGSDDSSRNEPFQPVGEVAAFIEEVILSPKPHFRNPISEKGKKEASTRFKDPSGDETIDTWMNK